MRTSTSLKTANAEMYRRSKLKDKSHLETYLFPSPRSVSRQGAPHIRTLAKACDRIERKVVGEAGVRFSPHDLRRTLVTKMRQMGISKDTVRKILNHAESRLDSDELLGTYDRHDQMPEVREALTRFGDDVLRLAKIQAKSAE